MAVLCQTVIRMIEALAPTGLAEQWDNIGLLVGDPQEPVKGVLVALDLNHEVIEEALAKEADFILVHHPPIFQPLKKLTTKEPVGKLLLQAVRQGLHICAAHTNLDKVIGGVSDQLAEVLGLTGTEPLSSTKKELNYKLVVFVPETHEYQVRKAIGDAGAGFIGNYSHCTFRAPGTGTFLPQAGANPFLGQVGEMEEAAEYRLETIVPEKLLPSVIDAMLEAHPYEEVAYDVYPLAVEGAVKGGLGRIGNLENPVSEEELIQLVKKRLQLTGLKVVPGTGEPIQRVAVCGGSGGSLVQVAFQKGAQALITGDVGYHEGQLAQSLGLTVIDAGHGPTEKVVLPWLQNRIEQALTLRKEVLPVFVSQVNTDPWRFY